MYLLIVDEANKRKRKGPSDPQKVCFFIYFYGSENLFLYAFVVDVCFCVCAASWMPIRFQRLAEALKRTASRREWPADLTWPNEKRWRERERERTEGGKRSSRSAMQKRIKVLGNKSRTRWGRRRSQGAAGQAKTQEEAGTLSRWSIGKDNEKDEGGGVESSWARRIEKNWRRNRFPAPRRAPEEPRRGRNLLFRFFFWEELAYGPTDNKDPLDMLFFLGESEYRSLLALLHLFDLYQLWIGRRRWRVFLLFFFSSSPSPSFFFCFCFIAQSSHF